MNQNASSAGEITEQMVKQSGITKKMAAQILHVFPYIIEDGLKKDGEVRVKGFGTFRLRWTRGRMGRNPKTGERIEIPSHSRVVFLPEHAFKEYINRDNRLLSYKIIPPADKVQFPDEIIPEPEIIEQFQYQEQYQPQPEFLPEPEPAIAPKPEPEPEFEPEQVPPVRRRRVHWIVPVAIGVIIILSLMFYFRNFYHTSQQSVVSSQQSTVSSQQSAVGGQKIEVDSRQLTVDSSQQSAVGGQQSAVGSQQEKEPTQNSELRTPNSELRTEHSELISEGNHLFRLAREIYGNPYLWVLIYKENLDKISDPDMVISGSELMIPTLEGTPENLTKNDSLAVSEGYRLVYEYLKAKDDSRALDFSWAMKRFKPKA